MKIIYENRLPAVAFQYHPADRISSGRPKLGWINQETLDLKNSIFINAMISNEVTSIKIK